MKTITAFTMTLALAAISFAQTAPAPKEASAPVKTSKVAKHKVVRKAKTNTASSVAPTASK